MAGLLALGEGDTQCNSLRMDIFIINQSVILYKMPYPDTKLIYELKTFF